jgi:hypothetical protein
MSVWRPAHLPDLLVSGREIGKDLERAVLDSQLGDDVLESALTETRQVEFLRKDRYVSLAESAKTVSDALTSASR